MVKENKPDQRKKKEQKKGKIKKQEVKRKAVGGLVFYPGKDVKHYLGVSGWVEQGMKDQCLIYDSVHNLNACQIPIVDCQLVNGLLIKRPGGLKKAGEATILVHNASPTTFALLKESTDQILCANTKSSHTMKY